MSAESSRSRALDYAAALTVAAAAAGLRASLTPVLDDALPFVASLVVVAWSAWTLGRGPAVAALLLGGALVAFYVLPPTHSFALAPKHAIGLVVYFALGAAIVRLVELRRDESRRGVEAGPAPTGDPETSSASVDRALVASARFQALFEQLPVFAGMVALDGTLIEANRRSRGGDGFARGDAIGESFAECAWWRDAPDWSERVRRGLLRAIAGEAFRDELPFRAADGSERIVDLALTPIQDDAGRTLFVAATAADVSERRLIESQLRESEERLRLAAAAARFGHYDADLTTGDVYWSPEMRDIIGVPRDVPAPPAGGPPDFIHPDDRAALLSRMQASFDPVGPGVFDDEHRVIHPDGSVHWVQLKGSTFFAGEGEARRAVRVAGVVIDVTDRHRTEEALADSARSLYRERERLSVALRAGKLGVYEWRIGSPVVWWSPEVYFVYGVDPHEFNPTVESFVALVHPDDRDELWRKTQESIERAEVFTHEYRVVRPDGSIRWIANRSHVALDDEGSVERITGVAADVTERKHAEEELQRLNAELRAADARKDEFLATLAHELRNPLAPIRNGLQVLRLAPGDAEALEAARGMMDRQLNQLVRLVDDLLDVSRISRGKIELRKRRVELAEIVRHAVETSRPLIDEAGHTLAVETPDDPLHVEADVARLAQVFSNLLNNAAKYTERGGRLRLAARREGSEAVVAVADSGVGIAQEMLARVFDMFTQLDRDGDRSQGGLGIGLSIVKSLVEMHGGRVEAASAGRGAGSEFVVRLPLAEAPAASPNDDAHAPAATVGRRVLVVDDNHDAAKSLAMMLRLMGHEARTAGDGLEALEVADGYRPELILLDIGMPRLNGHEAAKRIRERPWGDEVTLVALTGWGQDEDRRKSRDAGFDAHLVKPLEPAALRRILAQLPEAAR